MQSQPSLFINVFRFDGTDTPLESHGVTKTLGEAVTLAEEFADEYMYTLTDAGKIYVSSEFSEEYQDRRDFDATIDARIDAAKEERV